MRKAAIILLFLLPVLAIGQGTSRYIKPQRVDCDTMWVKRIPKIGAYVLPVVDGTTGQVLTTNGSGVVAWQNATVTPSMILWGYYSDSSVINTNRSGYVKIKTMDTALTVPDYLVGVQNASNNTLIKVPSSSIVPDTVNLVATKYDLTQIPVVDTTYMSHRIDSAIMWPDTVLYIGTQNDLIGKANVSDTMTYLLGQSRAASTYQPKGSYEVTTNKTSVSGTSTVKYATQSLVKAYADSVKGTISGSQWSTNGSSIYYNGGNVGIGTSAPTNNLAIIGGLSVNKTNGTAGYFYSSNGSYAINASGNGTSLGGYFTSVNNTALQATSSSGNQFYFGNDINSVKDSTMIMTSKGNVGIGTTEVDGVSKLYVIGPSSTTAIRCQSTSSHGLSAFSTSGAALYANSSSSYGLDAQSSTGIGIRGISGTNYGIFGQSTSGYGGYFYSSSGEGIRASSGTGNQYFFGNDKDATKDSVMVMTSGGKVGIGTTNPDSTFKVSGSVNITQGLNTGYDAKINGLTVGRGRANGYANTGLGEDVLKAVTTGTGCTAMGLSALVKNTGGYDNTAIGNQALSKVTTGVSNTALGSLALYNNTGNSNTAIGASALQANTSGTQNIAIGTSALERANTGKYNTAVGVVAGDYLTSGFSNTMVGNSALYSTTTGHNNVALGDSSGLSYTTLSNRMYLGSKADSATKGIYGDLTTGKDWYRVNGTWFIKTIPTAGSQPTYVLAPDANGLVQKYAWPTGTTYTGTSPIDVTGSVISIKSDTLTSWRTKQNRGESAFTSVAAKQDSVKNPWYYSSGNIIQRITGNVGIGSTNPMHRLVVVNDANNRYGWNFVDALTNKNRSTLAQAIDTSSFNLNWTNTGKAQLNLVSQGTKIWQIDSTASTFYGGTAAGSNLTFISTSGAGTSSGIAHQFKVGTNGGTTAMTILNDGKVGIGKTAPTYLLDVAGSVGATTFSVSGAESYTTSRLGFYTTVANIINSSTSANSAIAISTKNIEAMRIDPSQRVGIGTTAPTTKLHVKDGAIRAGVLQYQQSDSAAVRIVNTGKGVCISGDSAIRLTGTATVWEDLRVDGLNTNGGASEPALTNNFAGVSGMYQRLWQGSVSDDQLFFNVQLPHAWKQGGGFECHIHTFPWTTPGVADSVVWEFSYSWQNINGTYGAFTTDTTCVHMNGVAQWQHKLTELVNLGSAASGKTLSSILACRLRRLANSNPNDTYTGGMGVLYIDFHYEINSLGSESETTKLGN